MKYQSIEKVATQLAALNFPPPKFMIVSDYDYEEMKLRGINLDEPTKVIPLSRMHELNEQENELTGE